MLLKPKHYREIAEACLMLTLGGLASQGGDAVIPSLLLGLLGVIVCNYYHALRGNWVACAVGLTVSTLLFLIGIFF